MCLNTNLQINLVVLFVTLLSNVIEPTKEFLPILNWNHGLATRVENLFGELLVVLDIKW